MKKFRAKMKKIKMMRWSKLSLGEKIAKVIISLLKIAAIVAIGLALASVVVAAVMGVVVAFGIANAISGGLYNASKAYCPGDIYVNDRRLM